MEHPTHQPSNIPAAATSHNRKMRWVSLKRRGRGGVCASSGIKMPWPSRLGQTCIGL